MTKSDPKKGLSRFWWTVISAVVAGLVVEWIKDFPVTRLLARVSQGVWTWLRTPFLVERWYLYALSGLVLAYAWSILRRVFSRDPALPDFLAYQSDEFLGVDWRWGYQGRTIDADTIRPYCPECACQLVCEVNRMGPFSGDPVLTELRCDECGFQKKFDGHPSAMRERIGRLVERSVNTGDYAASMQRLAARKLSKK